IHDDFGRISGNNRFDSSDNLRATKVFLGKGMSY
ncbi:MAG: hypothetical protein RJA76_2037, partial [Bacteroidota bacterium]